MTILTNYKTKFLTETMNKIMGFVPNAMNLVPVISKPHHKTPGINITGESHHIPLCS